MDRSTGETDTFRSVAAQHRALLNGFVSHGFCFCVAAAFVFTSSAVTAALPQIERLRAGEHEDYVRLVIEMSQTSQPDIVPSVDGFALFFNGVQSARGIDIATAGPMRAQLETGLGDLTAIYIDGVTGVQPMRNFTLDAERGSGIRLVLDFYPKPFDNGFAETRSVQPPRRTPVPRISAIRWAISPPPLDDRVQPTQRQQVAYSNDFSADFAADDVMAGAPPPPPRPSQPAPSAPIRAILPDLKSRDRKINQRAFYGYVEAEARPYLEASGDGDRPRVTGSVAAQLTAQWAPKDNHALKVTGFGRVDAVDSQRTHAEVREAKYTGSYGDATLTLGFDTVFWGTAESFHLVDIINQIDGVEDIDEEDKRGELMVAGHYVSPIGTFSAYAMPLARQRTFPGADGRPNGPLVVDTDQAQFAGGNEWHLSWAARYSATSRFFDVGVSYFDGIARDPRLTIGLDNDDVTRLVFIPNYDEIRQVGLDAQVTLGPLLLKGEAIQQWNDLDDYAAFIAGFEYTAFNLFGSADVGLLSEFLYDDRGEGAPLPFEEDVFVGARLSLNNTSDTNILAGAIVDLDGDGAFINLEASTRLGKDWLLSLDARILTQSDQPSAFQVFQDDDFVQFRLQRYF